VPDPIVERLSSLPDLSRGDLRQLWRQLFPTWPPRRMQKSLMLRVISYRLQEQASGELSTDTRRRLQDLAQQIESKPNTSPTTAPAVKPGTRLIRQWKERTHIVTVADKSYEYQGTQYASLSQIARVITGISWSGPLFFGLKRNASVLGGQDEFRN
jgi:hypothetical protein